MFGLGRFLEEFSAAHSDDVLSVEGSISVEYETTIYYKLLKARDPVLWFKKVEGYPDFTIASNILGNRRRMAWSIGCAPSELFSRWREIMSHSGSFRISDHKPEVKQVQISEDKVNLFELPVCSHFLQDGSNLGLSRYVTSGLVVARDPSSPKTINLSYARMQLISETEYAFDLGSKGHFERYVEFSKRNEKTLPISVIVGAHPIYYMLAAAFVENEYSKASLILDGEYTNGMVNDIPVPSDAEIVIEAEVDPDRFVKEGPFSEFTGYVSQGTTGNLARVKSIFRKRHPVYYDIIPSNSNEHVNLFSMPRDCATTQIFQETMPQTSDYRLEWPPAAAHFLAFCEVMSPDPGLAKQAGLAVLALDPLFTKIVLVTEGRTDFGLSRFLMNLALDRSEGKIDGVSIIGNLFNIKLDPSSPRSGVTSKIVVVAKGTNIPFKRTVKKDCDREVRLENGSVRVIFSHEPTSEGEVNLVIGKDIDLTSEGELIWAFATRMRPEEDIKSENGHLIITANRKFAEVPILPSDVVEKVRRKMAGSLNP